MKTPQELKEEYCKLTSEEITRFKSLESDMKWVQKHPELTEQLIRRIENTESEIRAFKTALTWRLLNLIKQGYSLD